MNAVFEDRAGNVCFRGCVLGDARTTVFEGAKSTMAPAARDYNQRLGCFDGQRFDWFMPAAVTIFGWVNEQVTLQARTGEWWVGTGDGLYRFPAADSFAHLKTARPPAVYTTKDGLAAPQVFRLFEDSRGNVWVSTISPPRLAWLGGKRPASGCATWPTRRGCRRSRTIGRVRSVRMQGHVWIGFDRGLARYANGRFTLFTATDGLPPGAIMDIHVDRSGRLWLASARADSFASTTPARIDRPSSATQPRKGCRATTLEVIVEDADGHIYVGGGHGLDRLDPATGRVKHFTTADGLAPGLFRARVPRSEWRAVVRDVHGGSGPARAGRREAPGAAAGVDQRVARERVCRSSSRRWANSRCRCRTCAAPEPARDRLLRAGLSRSGEVLRYQYRLDGADADWSEPTRQRTVTYASLAPGRYTFIVRAVSSDGIASDRPATVTFRILQSGLAALVVPDADRARARARWLTRVYRYRVARLLEMAHMRTRIATDLHDDIGANLTRIALLSEVAEARTRAIDDGPLSSIARIARESVSSMSDIVWAINPKRESLLDLIRRMRQHADEVFTLARHRVALRRARWRR